MHFKLLEHQRNLLFFKGFLLFNNLGPCFWEDLSCEFFILFLWEPIHGINVADARLFSGFLGASLFGTVMAPVVLQKRSVSQFIVFWRLAHI